MTLWSIEADSPREIPVVPLDLESRLESWVMDDPNILGLDVVIIGQQIATDFGGFIDLLAIDAGSDLVVIELKRGRTPREVVAQALDYATWIKMLTPRDVHRIASDHLSDRQDLDTAFSDKFGIALPEQLNADHSILIVASELDDSSERIISYLVEQYGVNINGVFFNVFSHGENEYLGRSWLASPEKVDKTSAGRKQAPWTGYWYVNVDEGESRNWEDSREYGFISAGGGRKYSSALDRLSEGGRVFAYQKGMGYVGYGEVLSPPVMAKEFVVQSKKARLSAVTLRQPTLLHDIDDPELCEWVVGVEWITSFARDDARKFPGIFANQNVVCKLRDEKTLKFLKQEFNVEDDSLAPASPE